MLAGPELGDTWPETRRMEVEEMPLQEGHIGTILVPTDFSEGAAYALRWARALARAFGAKIIVLHVLDLPVAWTPLGGLGSIPTPISAESVEQLTIEAQTILDTMAQGASEVAHRVVRDGHPREVILAAAKEVGADVVVMGTHGRRGVSQLFIGSVAEHVVRHSPVPVLTVRGDEP
jgi:nucleotide-binding universal stress UspA family protein